MGKPSPAARSIRPRPAWILAVEEGAAALASGPLPPVLVELGAVDHSPRIPRLPTPHCYFSSWRMMDDVKISAARHALRLASAARLQCFCTVSARTRRLSLYRGTADCQIAPWSTAVRQSRIEFNENLHKPLFPFRGGLHVFGVATVPSDRHSDQASRPGG